MHGPLNKSAAFLKAPPDGVPAARRAAAEPERLPLLTGLVLDARGGLMEPSRAATLGAARYYVGTTIPPGGDAPERIPATRLDASVVAMLRRIRLIGDTWQRSDVAAILRRVVVLDDGIILQLDKRLCLAAWRAQEPMLQRITTADVLRLIGTCLTATEKISEAGTTFYIRMPRHSRARKIRPRAARNALLFQDGGEAPSQR